MWFWLVPLQDGAKVESTGAITLSGTNLTVDGKSTVGAERLLFNLFRSIEVRGGYRSLDCCMPGGYCSCLTVHVY